MKLDFLFIAPLVIIQHPDWEPLPSVDKTFCTGRTNAVCYALKALCLHSYLDTVTLDNGVMILLVI